MTKAAKATGPGSGGVKFLREDGKQNVLKNLEKIANNTDVINLLTNITTISAFARHHKLLVLNFQISSIIEVS